MASAVQLNHDLRAVLKSLVATPNAKVFAGSVLRRLSRDYGHGSDAPIAAPPSPFAAEGHLVALHRRELAMALQEAFYSQFFAPCMPHSSFMPTRAALTQAQWKSASRFARDTAPMAAYNSKSASWMRRILDGEELRCNTTCQSLLAASLNLVDSPNARLYSALSYLVFEHHGPAVRILSELAVDAPHATRLTALRATRNRLVESRAFTGAFTVAAQTLNYLDKCEIEHDLHDEVAALEIINEQLAQPFSMPTVAVRVARQHRPAITHAKSAILTVMSRNHGYASALAKLSGTSPKDQNPTPPPIPVAAPTLGQ